MPTPRLTATWPAPAVRAPVVGCHNTADLSQVGVTNVVNTNIHSNCLHPPTTALRPLPTVAYNPANDTCGSGCECHATAGLYNTTTFVHNGATGAGLADGNDTTTTPPTWHRPATQASTPAARPARAATPCALKTAHTASSAGSVTCAGCHNDTTLGWAAQVKASWTNNRCTDCHTATGVHTAFESGRRHRRRTRPPRRPAVLPQVSAATPPTTWPRCTPGTPGGCATCHATDKDMSAVSKTCGPGLPRNRQLPHRV